MKYLLTDKGKHYVRLYAKQGLFKHRIHKQKYLKNTAV